MSNFLDSTFSPSTDTIPDEPVAQEIATEQPEKRRAIRIRAPQSSYKMFHYVLLAYLFLYCTRLPELFPAIRASLALNVILLAGAVATGRGMVLLRTKMGKLMAAFTVWTAICVPFSVWIGGSVQTLKSTLLSMLIAAFIVAFIGNLREVRNAMYTIGVAMATVALLSMFTHRVGGMQGERLGMGESATLQDPNFMSLYLLVGLPFIYLGVTRGKTIVKVIYAALIPVVLLAIARSASRMALILFIAGLAIFLFRASQKERFAIVAAVGVLAAITIPVLPQSVTKRFTTFFQSDTPYTQSEAVESAQSRLELLIRSIELTAMHPVFGVGPGQFPVAEDKLAKSEGKARGLWYYTHNAYTEVSSETGIIGAVLYIMAIVAAYRGLASIRRRGSTKMVRDMAKYIQLSLWMVILGGFFLTIGFGGVPFVIMALAAAFKLAVAEQTKSTKTEAVAA